MWDYDKLFAENNVIGLKALHNYKIFVHGVSDECHWEETNRVNWHDFKNKELKVGGFEIQYIIRLDEHGNVVEKLFDRERDIPKPMPELEDGMFIRIADDDNYYYGNTLAYVDFNRNRIICQDGCWCSTDDIINKEGVELIEIYENNVNNFNGCVPDLVVWRSPEYQAYLDSKSN